MSRRLYNYLAALVAALIFSLASISAHAATYSAQAEWLPSSFPGDGWSSTQSAACQKLKSHTSWTAAGAGSTLFNCTYTDWQGNAGLTSDDVLSMRYSCPNGGTLNGTTCEKTCAAGETLSASGVCETPCGAGQTRVNGVCTFDTGAQVGTDGTCCPVAGSGGGAGMQWCYVDSKAASTCDSAGTNGCKVRCNNVTFQQGTGSTVQIYPKLALGQNCSYTGTIAPANTGGGALNNDELAEVDKATKKPDQAKTPEGCLASGQGYIQTSSGTTCVSGGDSGVKQTTTENKTSTNNGQTTTENKTTETTQAPNGETKQTETTTTNNPNGTTTTTTKTTSKNADGTVTTETSSTTKDGNGNTVSSSNNNNNQSAKTFCQENPDSAVCKGFNDTCKDNPERAGCKDIGTPTEEGEISSQSIGVSAITPVSFASSASCPADIPLPKGSSLSFRWPCDLATGLRPILLALAWLSAGLIVMGAFRSNG